MKFFSEHQPPTQDLTEFVQQWNFELSNFQLHALASIINGNHVLITAHTGSGKTLPAEFAIRYFTQKGKRVIYTSPIKALTNEKFHDFTHKFPDIDFGLITGDIKYNPDADVLLMTQEILTNTLTQRKLFESGGMLEDKTSAKDNLLSFEMDFDNELGCVVMDEAHYINDRDRGRVWEEGIMWLPINVQLVMLSATIAKVEELCRFVEQRGGAEVCVCSTTKRVVPLTHYTYMTIPTSNIKKIKQTLPQEQYSLLNNLVPLKTTTNKFDAKIYARTMKLSRYMEHNRIRVNRYFAVNELLNMLAQNNDLPAIIFVFSRKQVNILASKIQTPLLDSNSKIPSIIEKECETMLRKKLPNYKEYLVLPEYQFIIGLLKKGIAIHHAGMLKEFREMIELVFKYNYIKVLLATETFAVGINMPTRTTVFTSLKKFDGAKFRWLHSPELTQMAGRAGRRGIDNKGKVVYMMNLFRDKPCAQTFHQMLNGAPKGIESKFAIHATLLLRLISVKNFNFKEFINQSMMTTSIQDDTSHFNEQICSLRAQLSVLEKGIQTSTQLTTHAIPEEIRKEYADLQASKQQLRGKRKKRCFNKLLQFESEYKNIKNNYLKSLELGNKKRVIHNEIHNLENQIKNAQTYIEREIEQHIQFLENEQFICNPHNKNADTGVREWTLTDKGRISLALHELPSLPISEVIYQKHFKNLSAVELSGVLSCFTNLHIPEEQSIVSISNITASDSVKCAIQNIKNICNYYFDKLTRMKVDIVENYEMHYNLCELTILWCNANTEAECLKILSTAKSYDIQLGDFVKAMLKIINVTKELEKSAIISENLELLEKLRDIPQLIMKSCITNQSLYL